MDRSQQSSLAELPATEGDNSTYRTPPVNYEAEQALLAAILTNHRAFERVADFLQPAHFADDLHGRIFEACGKLIERGQIADALTLKNLFEQDDALADVGGGQYLAKLQSSYVSIINAADYGRTIHDLHLRRELIGLGEDVVNDAFDHDPDTSAMAQIETAEQRLYNLAEAGRTEGGFRSFKSAVIEAVEMTEAAFKRDSHVAGVSTGFTDLDKLLGGLHHSDLIILAGRPSMGKAQPLDAKVKTIDGWKTMAQLRLADQLASIDGRGSIVSGIFPQGVRQIYRVTFSDGRSTECCAEHLWRVHYREWDSPRILRTDNVAALLKRKRYQRRMWIDMCSGDFGHDEPLPIDPWLLGVLIGDGNLSGGSVRLSPASNTLLDQVAEAIGQGYTVKAAGGYDYRIVQTEGHRRPGRQGVWPNKIKNALSDLGLWNLRSNEKFIPRLYMTANREARLALLGGLMDTDGWIERWGSLRFGTTSERLADDVVEMARSLGAWCTKHQKRARYTYVGESREGQAAYVCNIHYSDPRSLFTLAEKRQRAAAPRRRRRPVFVSIEPTRKAEARCIAVTHPEHLYVTDSYVVTHNTALATNIAYNTASSRRKETGPDGSPIEVSEVVAFFSLEMSAEQLATRIISEQAHVRSDAMRRGEIRDEEFDRIFETSRHLHGLPLFIDDTPALAVPMLRTRARRLKRQQGLSLIVVDYLQLMRGQSRSENRVQEISEITRGLKAVAKELDVPVLALSQLSRQTEQRDDKRPQLADLRESGSIEQDADVVMFLFREEYYLARERPSQHAKEEDDNFQRRLAKYDELMKKARNKAEVIIAKQRHGPIGIVELHFAGEFTQFNNLVQDDHLPDDVPF
ncbi:MAG: replicative DNA helicase [Kiloniellaceae bacterium]